MSADRPCAVRGRVAYLDAQAGIAGDMVLGALIGLGLEPAFFEEVASRLGLRGVRVEARSVRRSGIQGWAVQVIGGPEHSPHRHLGDILEAIEASELPQPVVAAAREVFEVLGRAESAVHGATLESVHFHEVGAVDSIVDIVGAVAGLHELGVERVVASSLPLAPGEITFSHGTHALPAPAVAELVSGLEVHGVEAGGAELVTPTGAALVKVLVSSQGPMPSLRVSGHGRGAGTTDIATRANLLRIFLGDDAQATLAPDTQAAEAILVAAAIDDMNPQLYARAFEELFAAGADDVHCTPLLMKKGRPGQLLEVLCRPELEAGVVEALLLHTSSLGCRVVRARKHALGRRERIVSTPYGEVSVKEALLRGEPLRARPEYEDAARLAAEQGVPVAEVIDAARAAARGAGE